MKKFTTMAICFVLIACMVAGGSLAYLTDRDSVANVFTVGDVRIELTEDFAQGATLTPGVDIKKEPIIKNTGINDAWVWAQIAFPSALDNDDASKNVVHFNYEADYVNAAEWTWTDDQGAWLVEKDVTINDAKYNVYTVLYQTALERGQETKPVMTNVYMDTNVDIDNEGNWSIVEKGVVTPLDWNTNTNGAPIIYVSAYAVQAEGFDTVQKAYAAYNEQWTTDAGVNNGLEWATPATLVDNAADLAAALTAGESVVLTADIDLAAEQIVIPAGKDVTVDLNGHDLTGNFNEAGHYAMFTIPNGASLTINGDNDSEVKANTAAAENNRSLALFLNAGNLTINGGEYNVTDASAGKTWIIATIVDNRTNNASCNAKLTINGGDFSVDGTAKNLFRNYPQQGGTATLIINDGTFHDTNGATTYIWNQEASTYLGELYFNGGIFDAGVVYEDYNGQSDIHIKDGVTINAYSGNN